MLPMLDAPTLVTVGLELAVATLPLLLRCG